MKKTMWAYLDGERLMDVVKKAWAGNVEVDSLMRRLVREYPGHEVTFKVEEAQA